MATSDDIRGRLEAAGLPYLSNDNVSRAVQPGDLTRIEEEVAGHVRGLLRSLVIDVDRDPGSQKTPERVAKMLVREVMCGRYEPVPAVTSFENTRELDEVYAVGPVDVRSMCSHHLVPVVGRAWVGVLPDRKLIGLSKFSRLTSWVMARPQMQEEATIQLADLLEEMIEPRGLALVVRASHMCMTWRGVRDSSAEMVTSVMRGAFLEKPAARAEFLALARPTRST